MEGRLLGEGTHLVVDTVAWAGHIPKDSQSSCPVKNRDQNFPQTEKNKGAYIQWNLRIMDTFGTSHFVLYREVVLSSEVKMYKREVASKYVLYRDIFPSCLLGVSFFIRGSIYRRGQSCKT